MNASFNNSSVQGTEMRLLKHETDFFSPNGRGGGGGGGGGEGGRAIRDSWHSANVTGCIVVR